MNVVEKEKALLGRKNRNSEGYYIEREDLQIMKCVGIIGAMEQEVARLKEVMENVSITTRAGMDFYEGILEGKKAACYPGFEDKLKGAEVVFDQVVRDGNVTTSRGMGTAIPFALDLVSQLVSEEKAQELKTGIIYG